MADSEALREAAIRFGAKVLERPLLCEWGNCLEAATVRRMRLREQDLANLKDWAFGTPPAPIENGWYETRIRLCPVHLNMMAVLMKRVDRGSNG